MVPIMMQRILSRLVLVSWALWFGGVMALFLFVQALFWRFADTRDIAGAAASALFVVFEKYQLLLAGSTLLLTVLWRWRWPTARQGSLFALLALATVAAVGSGAFLTPRMEALRQAGTSGGPEFARLHGLSMLVYSTEALLLLAAGLVWPRSNRESRLQ